MTFRPRVGLIVIIGLLVIPGASPLTDSPVALASLTKAEAALEGSLVVEDPEIREIIAQPTLRRRISPIRFAGDRRTYEFLVRHPPLATQLARRLHPPLERYTVTQIAEGVYTVEDRGVLRGGARLIAATGDQRIYRFQGEFRSLGHILHFTGRMVLILRYREVREGSRIFMDSNPDFYLRIDHPFFHVMTKLLSPLITSIMDRRVKMVVEATRTLFDQVQTDPNGLYQQMSTWPDVQPSDLEAFRQTFLSKEATVR
ncbi:MAG: hypothetical protein KGL31_00980 [candidate division NC10 bacterium]|nr:hypothetical protein [candidate division NC10 bacterium]MDE2320485.1 hypothetical protein [candidate division NC10 bacterium]